MGGTTIGRTHMCQDMFMGTPRRTDIRHAVSAKGDLCPKGDFREERWVAVFAPAEVTYDEIKKAMQPKQDSRFVRPTSNKGNKWVYYPATMHADACTCSECKMNE